MPVISSTQVETYQSGFRGWVNVSNDGTGGGGPITVDVKLEWDPAKANYVAADPNSTAPTVLTPALGLAVWTGRTIAADDDEDFGVILQCAFGVTSTVTVTGTAVNVTTKQSDSSSDSWSCALGGPA